MSAIFKDENETWQIDFSSAKLVRDDLNETFKQIKGSIFKDVDCVAIDEKRILFVECKNSNFTEVNKPEAFNPLEENRLNGIVRKYCDSLMYIRSLIGTVHQEKNYIFIVETFNGDSVLRKKIRNRLKKMLPFAIQENENLKESIIDEIQVYSIDEWNEKFPEYHATRLKEQLHPN